MVIELRNVNVYHHSVRTGLFRTRRGDMVLSDVTLSVDAGQMVYFIGKVGSGKSSLLRTLYAELPLLEGSGSIAGFDLAGLRRRDVSRLRRSIGIVFQDNQLLTDRNVFDNLHYVMRATGWRSETDIRRRIDQVITMVDLENKLYKMPFELSGGEQQRVGIARALVNSPKVILADEPTGNLDPRSGEDVMEIFSQIVAQGCSVVMSTHNMNIVQAHPARTFRFSRGRVEELDISGLLDTNTEQGR